MDIMYLKTKKLAVLIIAAVALLSMVFSGAASADGIAPSEELNDEYPVSFYMKYGDIYKLNDTPTKVSDVKKQYGYKSAYAIRNLSELQGIGTDSNIYILTQDIYCTTPTSSAIIGTFTGTLIGNGYTIYNLTINGNTQKIGLVGTLGTSGTLNYVNLMCANISSDSSNVGGLVGYANSASNITGCTVMHSDISSSSDYVGGLVGFAKSASLNVENCSVENNSISSSSDYVGGLVGNANSVSVLSCDVKNSTVSGVNNVGGLAGRVHSSDVNVEVCNVVNSMVCAGSENVGGLVGYAEEASVVSCDVKNSTVSGSNRVGGLVGYASSANFTGCTAEDCVVAGTGSDVNENYGCVESKIGSDPSSDHVIVDNLSDATLGWQINVTRVGESIPGTYHIVHSKLIPAVDNPYTFFKELVKGKLYGYGYKSYVNTSSDVYFTNLGAYGTAHGFGYYPTYTVTYNGNGNESGSVPVDTTWYIANATVTVKENTGNLARTGYIFNGWNVGSTSGDLKHDGETFNITTDTILYANWTLSPYIEVNTWAGLNKSIAEWTNTTEARTVVVTASIMDRVAGNNTEGINVYGKIILTTNASPVDNKAVIDGKGLGRLFYVHNDGYLALTNYQSPILNLTGGNASIISPDSDTFGGAIYVDGGTLTLTRTVKITNCTASHSGGGIYLDSGTFTMYGGNIAKCTAEYGGGVMVYNGTFTMNSGSITNCTADEGGSVYSDDMFIMTGGRITNCTAEEGGGVYSSGMFTMTGGSITGCDSTNDAGSVLISGGMFNVSGSGVITGNTANGSISNVYLGTSENLNLVGPFTGTIGISTYGLPSIVGAKFGNVTAGASGAENFIADDNAYHIGTISGDMLVWKDTTPSPSYSGSTKHNGYTQILSEGQVVPTTTPTAKPTAAPTQVTPTAKPTTQATTQPTQSSPAPVAGLIAGLGAAALVLARMRK